MKDEDKIFQWGVGLLCAMFVIGAALQVCYRAQSRSLARTRAGIVKAQQETADAATRFSALIRPEVLRSISGEVFPRFESIGFKKNINIGDIPIQKDSAETTPGRSIGG